MKYSGSHGSVRVELRRDGNDVVLTVADNGPGIPEEDLPRVFERFYRVDKARSRAAGGTGLGLSIVQDTVTKRGGTVSAANRPEGGAVFTVRWPGGGRRRSRMKKRWMAVALTAILLMAVGGAIGTVSVRQESANVYDLYFVERDLRAASGSDALRAEERVLSGGADSTARRRRR